MASPLQSLIQCGTKLWLDSVDPELVAENRAAGATGATSNPIIIANLVKTGRFDNQLGGLLSGDGVDIEQAAWRLTDQIVTEAERVFAPVWQTTKGDDGYVSFELDPLIEDPDRNLPHEERVERYVELGKRWASEHRNRMIKVPATPAGIDSLESLATAGIPLNVTLVFTQKQYEQARDAVWRGAQRRQSLKEFKSVYSIFVSRVDVYTQQHAADLSPAAQGQVGLVNAKQIWASNQAFWKSKDVPLAQEIVFASTGTKDPADPPWKYVEALAGSDIQTNPPATNEAVRDSGLEFASKVGEMPDAKIIDEIAAKVNVEHLEEVLMREGVQKFVDPQRALLALLEQKLAELTKA